MSKRRKFGGQIIAVVPEHCAGPGWTNSPLWVIWRDDNNVLHQDCIQSDEQTAEIRYSLFDIGAVVCRKLIKAVEAMGNTK